MPMMSSAFSRHSFAASSRVISSCHHRSNVIFLLQSWHHATTGLHCRETCVRDGHGACLHTRPTTWLACHAVPALPWCLLPLPFTPTLPSAMHRDEIVPTRKVASHIIQPVLPDVDHLRGSRMWAWHRPVPCSWLAPPRTTRRDSSTGAAPDLAEILSNSSYVQ